MPYRLKDNNGVICSPMTFRDATNLTPKFIAEQMKEQAEAMGVPMAVETDYVTEGGLFGKSYPCVCINHPNAAFEYYTDVLIVNGNTVNFYFFGYSKANYRTNKANARADTLSGMFLNALSGSMEMEIQQENVWHSDVIEVFKSLIG